MRSTYFTPSEAESKIGKTVISLIDFANVPKGSRARVVSSYLMPNEKPGLGLMIAWSAFNPLQDGFSKDEYEQFLQEV